MKSSYLWYGAGFIGFIALIVSGVLSVRNGWWGTLEGPGVIEGAALPVEVIADRRQNQSTAQSAIGAPASKQILFGDLHLHTTYSTDAFLWSLPMLNGEGPHPLADACDYARYCSGIDFWAATDHAEALTPPKWAMTKDAVRQCNAVAGDPENPDLVAFLGFEWTQVGRLPEQHYGHKNVIFEGLDDDEVSIRAIAASGGAFDALRESEILPRNIAFADWKNRSRYFNFRAFMNDIQNTPLCNDETPSHLLPEYCVEVASTPADLTRKLEEQGLDYLLIPHGTSWGFYTPPGTTLDKQLLSEMRPEKQELVEIYSGHGNAEEYRPWRAVTVKQGENGVEGECPAPRKDYTPPCWRAGEIIFSRCISEGQSNGACLERAASARRDAANMGVAYHLAIKGETPEDWLDSGQCTDCFLPTFQHRPAGSVQYGLAISGFEEDGENPKPNRFHWGFIASSDNHRARPGTGYKEIDRLRTTEMGGPVSEEWHIRINPSEDPLPYSVPISRNELIEQAGFGLTETERQTSFWLTGGLAAVHSEGRSRAQIWDALKRRETYATSGPRILLWFDKIDGSEPVVMGGKTATRTVPEFRARAIGAFKQKPGCPAFTANGLPASRVENLCAGECYNPSDTRHLITRIEVVRIRPQAVPGENIDPLIEDPWQVFECPAEEAGCEITFRDPEFIEGERDVTYYVRAIQEPTRAINADPLECERDENGKCVSVNLCRADYRSDPDDDCTDPVEERAWSSPIYLSWAVE